MVLHIDFFIRNIEQDKRPFLKNNAPRQRCKCSQNFNCVQRYMVLKFEGRTFCGVFNVLMTELKSLF